MTMNSTVLMWLGFAVLLFWAVGAYNRLVRLRSQGIAAFGVLEGLLSQFVPLAGSEFAESGGLDAAADQFRVALKMCHAQPLNGARTNALTMAYETMCLGWQRQRQVQADPPVLDAPPLRWEQLVVQAEMARADFNKAVARYNAAIAQFPAALLARVFGFRPAQPL